MTTPRPAVNGATTSVGLTTRLVTVQSISPDGTTAICIDRTGTQVSVPMMIQPSKGTLPAVGDTWLLTQALGSWTFSAFVGGSATDFQQNTGAQGVHTGATPPGVPSVGELWVDSSNGNMLTAWNGTNWVPLQFGAIAIQPGSLTSQQLSEEAAIAASQVNFTVSDIGGITTTLSATAPANPSFNDLWYDAGNGYRLNQWSGTEWIPYQWGTGSIAARTVTAELIAANTITAEELAAGIIYAGIINGTIVNAATFVGSTFEGTDFILNAAGGFWYSSTPGLGNLFVNITSQGGVDTLGNSYQAGIFVYGPSGSFISLEDSGSEAIIIINPAGAAHLNVSPQILTGMNNPGAANESASLVLSSGKESSNHDAGIQLFAESADTTIPAKMVFEFGGSVAGTITDGDGQWHQITSLSNSWTGSGGGVNGVFYRTLPFGLTEVIGDIINTTATGNSNFATLPAGAPSTNQNHPAAWNNPVTSNSASPPWVAVNTGGTLQMTGIEVANKEIFFHILIPTGSL